MNNELGNYTGPYWSDGKLQTSVMFGEAEAVNALDELSRLHDTVYAKYPDRAHREAADMWYNSEAKKLTGQFPQLAANAVLYGNYASRQAGKLANDVKTYSFLPGIGGIIGAAKFAVDNISNAQKMINGTYLKKEKEDIFQLFEQDPAKKNQLPSSSQVVPGDVGMPKKKKVTQVVPEKPGPSAVIIKNENIKQKQRERFEDYQEKYQEALESNLNKAKTRHVSSYLKEKGRLSRAVQAKKKNKKKFDKNKVCPQ